MRSDAVNPSRRNFFGLCAAVPVAVPKVVQAAKHEYLYGESDRRLASMLSEIGNEETKVVDNLLLEIDYGHINKVVAKAMNEAASHMTLKYRIPTETAVATMEECECVSHASEPCTCSYCNSTSVNFHPVEAR